ncbi:MAG: hypothetical protein JSV83_04450, partial [Desulfobacterales bacterium]
MNTNDFQIEGRLGSLADIFDKNRPFPVALNLRIADFLFAVSGTIADPVKGEGLNLELIAEEQEFANLLNILQLEVPRLGRLKFNATLSGDFKAAGISKLNLAISDGSSLELSAKGSVANLFSGAGTDISISEECSNNNLLKKIFPENWQVVQEFRFKASLHNVQGVYTLDDIDAFATNDKGISIKAGGWLRFGDFFEGPVLKEVDLKLNLSSPHTASIRPLITDAIPEIGPVTAEGRLTGPIDRLALEDLVIRRGGSGPVKIETTGRIGWIPLEADKPIADIDLVVSIQSEQSTVLSSFYGVPIGEIGTVSLKGRLEGSTDRFQLKNIELRTADRQGLKTTVFGAIDFSERENGDIVGDVNFKVRIIAPNLAKAEPLMGASLFSNLGPVIAESSVTGTTEALSFENIAVIAGQPELVQVDWRGRIGKIPLADDQPISDVQSVASIRATKTSALGELLGISVPDIGPLQGSWRVVHRNKIIGFDDVNIVIGDGEKLHLKAGGTVDSVYTENGVFIDGVHLQLSVRAPDTHTISRLIDIQFPDLGAVDGRLALSGSQDLLSIRNAEFTVTSPSGLEIVASGAVNEIGLEKQATIQGIDVQFTARTPNIAAVPALADSRLPDIGP